MLEFRNLDIGCYLFPTQDDGNEEEEDGSTHEDEVNDEDSRHDEREEEEKEEEEEEEEMAGDTASDPPGDSEFIEVSFVMTSPPIRPKTCKRQRLPRFANGRTYKGIKAVLPMRSPAWHEWSGCHAARVLPSAQHDYVWWSADNVWQSMTACGVVPSTYCTA